MKWRNWLIGACCMLFVAVIVTPTGLYSAIGQIASGPDAPDWVQAVGSVAAIIGAWLLGTRQFAHERKLESDRRQQASEESHRRSAKRDRDAIDAMILAADIAANVAAELRRANFERPFDVDQASRWIRNAEDLLAYHASRDRDWADLVLTLFSAQRCLPPVRFLLQTHRNGPDSDQALSDALKSAHRSLQSNVRELTPDEPYVAHSGDFSPKHMTNWPA